MKTMKICSALFFVLLTLFSCQKEGLTVQEEGAITGLAVKNMKVARTAAECAASTLCIDPANPVYFHETGDFSASLGSGSKNIHYDVYNTLSGFTVALKYTREGNQGQATINVNVTVGSEVQTITQMAVGTTYILTFGLPAGWKSCDALNWSINETAGQGNVPVNGSGTYYLYGACVVGCDESFSYTKNLNGSYTFNYTPKADVDDAHLVFTFAQGVAETVTGLDGWSVNGSTRQTTMDLEACHTYSWTVTITPDCSGNSQNSNVWTDFKVNDVSKKGSNPNIVIPCPL